MVLDYVSNDINGVVKFAEYLRGYTADMIKKQTFEKSSKELKWLNHKLTDLVSYLGAQISIKDCQKSFEYTLNKSYLNLVNRICELFKEVFGFGLTEDVEEFWYSNQK